MTRIPSLGLICSLFALVGCSSAAPISPTPTATGDAVLPTLVTDGSTESVIGRWTLEINAGDGSANLTPIRTPADNDALFRLPVDAFLRLDSLRIEKLRRIGDGLELTWRFTHPFRSSATSGRADLGFTGFLVFLLDVPTSTGHSFFEPPVIVNTTGMLDPDAYWDPASLIPDPGTTATAFPTYLLVDDTGTGNRLDAATDAAIPNGGIPKGNFDPTLGWQTLPSESWTGYDVLHQGQAARGTILLNLNELAGPTPFRFEVAVVAKYSDPKSGVPGITHRLPRTPADVLSGFGYRYPHGALDVSQVTYRGESGGFIAGEISASELRFHVRDWDARAIESSGALRDDPVTSHVTVGAAGTPLLEVSIPDLFDGPANVEVLAAIPTDDDSAFGGDFASDSGIASDELYFEGTITKTGIDGNTPGLKSGLLRVTDIEAAGETQLINIDGNLVPLTGALPQPITYQAFQVTTDTPPPPTGGWAVGAPASGNQVGQRTWAAPNGDVYTAGTFDAPTDFGSGIRTPAGANDCVLVKYTAAGVYVWDVAFGGAGPDSIEGLTGDPLSTTISLAGYINGSMQVTTGAPTWTSAGNDAFIATLTSAGAWVGGRTFGSAGNDSAWDLVSDAAGNLYTGGDYSGTVNFGGGPHAALSTDSWVASYTSGFTYRWERLMTGTGLEYLNGLAMMPSGDVAVCAIYNNRINVGSGLHITHGNLDGIVLRLNETDGALVWDRTYGGILIDQWLQIAVGTNDQIVMGGYLAGVADYGLGSIGGSGTITALALSLDGSGTLLWTRAWGVNGYLGEWSDVAFPDGGDVYLIGDLNGTTTVAGIPVAPQGKDVLLARLDPATANGIWVQTIGGAGDDVGNGLSIGGPTNELIWTGKYQALPAGVADLRPGPLVFNLTGDGTDDWVVSKVESNGLW